MQTLKPSYYKLQINLLDKREGSVHTYDSYIRVYSEKEPFREKEEALETDWLDYHYKKYDTLHIIGFQNSKSKITGLYITNYGRVDESLYTILYDSRAAELSAVLLEICKNAKETCFEVVFDDGKRETLTIVNPYLQ
jgi:hypothetical protein